MEYTLDGVGYKIIGKGEPVFFVHGGPGMTCRYFERFAETFSKFGYSCFLIDQRGNGKSKEFDIENISFDEILNDFEKIRIHHNLKKVYLIGHSFGGFLVLKHLIENNESILKAVVIDSIGATKEHFNTTVKLVKKLIKADITENDLDIIPDGVSQIFYSNMRIGFPNKELFKARINDIFDDNVDYDKLLEINKKLTSEFIDSLPVQLDKIEQPIFVIHGEYDFISQLSSEYISEKIPNSILKVIPDAGHFAMDDDEILVSKLIDRFFKPNDQLR